MLKKLMIGTALSGLLMSGALAQSPTPMSPPAKSPTASQSAPSSGAGSANFISSQQPDQWLASKFKGTDVVGADEQKIGDVSDILFDKDGKILAYVVGVGGFLGMGSKNVALAPTSFQVIKGTNGSEDKLRLSMSKDQLKQAQNFEPYKPPRATTGMAPRPMGGGGLGGGLAPRPSTNTPPSGNQ